MIERKIETRWVPRLLHILAASPPENERAQVVQMEAARKACFFAFTSLEQAEFFIEQSGIKFVPLPMLPEDFARLHLVVRDRVKYVAINPRARDFHRHAEFMELAELSEL